MKIVWRRPDAARFRGRGRCRWLGLVTALQVVQPEIVFTHRGLAALPWRCHAGVVGATRVAHDAPAGDARLTAGVSAACLAAFAVFVVVPSSVPVFALPPGVDAVWAMGGLLTIVLGPVVAGLCGYVSFTALWLHGGALPARSRRLHLVTLLLVAAVWLGLVSSWGSDVVSWWLD